MFILLISLPLAIMLISASFLFIDLKKPKSWMITLPIFFLEVALLGLFIYLASLLNADQKTLIKKIMVQEEQIAKSLQSTNLIMARLSVDPDKTNSTIKQSMLYGLTPKSTFFDGIRAANTELDALMRSTNRMLDLADIEVWQIPEDVNQVLVKQILVQLGFKAYFAPSDNEQSLDPDAEAMTLENMTTEEPDGTLTLSLNFHEPPHTQTSQLEDIPEGVEPLPKGNVISVGRRVTAEDGKIVALVLMRAGMDLKHIRRIRKPTRANERAVIVEYNKLYDRRASLSAEFVVGMKEFR